MKSNHIGTTALVFRTCSILLCTWSASCGFGRIALAADESQLVDKIVQSAGITRGLCVHLGCGDGKLTVALGIHPDLVVHGLESDSDLTDRARRLIDAEQLHGRVSVASGTFVRLPYVDDSVNLLVAPHVGASGVDVKRLRELVRVLSPNGVGLLGGWTDDGKSIERAAAELRSTGLDDVTTVDIDGPWLRFVKPRPANVDDWTHLNHNAGGNRLSLDEQAGPPTRLRWIDGPAWNTEANGPGSALSIDGQLLYHFDEAPHGRPQQNWSAIYARDAYNGLLHWKRRVEGFNPLCFVANSKHVFTIVTTKGNLVALDRKTGEVAINYDEATFPEWVVFHRGDLYMSAGGRYSRRLMCIDAESGRVKWRSELAIQSSGPLPNFVVADELGYYLDWQRLTLGCVELATGKSRWEQDVSDVLTRLKWRYGLCSHGHGTLVVGEGMRGSAVHAFADRDGKHLWRREYTLVVSGRGQRHKGSTYDDGFFIDGLYWTHVGLPRDANGRTIGGLAWEGLDPATGKVRRRFAYSEDVVVGDSCHRTQATVNYFMGGHSRFVSTKTGEYVPRAYGIHNSCRFGMLPANGLTYTWSQYTATYVRGVMGLATGDDRQAGEIDVSERFVKGPAYAAVKRVADETDSWTCFRGDPQRSARSLSNAFQAKPSLLWQTKFDRDLSPTVAVGDLAFVAQPDAYRVAAVRASSGEVAWKFLTGGRVTSSPTIYQGLCLFGCADGWTYCLTASDGKLIWRFRAARREQLIVDRGRLASVWPVDGGVLVDNALAFFAVVQSAAAELNVTNIRAFHRDGQTFVTWKDVAEGEAGADFRYSLYCSDRPITENNTTDMNDGKTDYYKRMDMVRFVSEHPDDLPFIGCCCGRHDGFATFKEQIEMVKALTAAHHGFAFAWNDGNHSTGGTRCARSNGGIRLKRSPATRAILHSATVQSTTIWAREKSANPMTGEHVECRKTTTTARSKAASISASSGKTSWKKKILGPSHSVMNWRKER